MTIAVVWLGNVRAVWGLLIFGALLLGAVVLLYRTERRYSAEGIDMRKIDALENVELARVEGDNDVQKMHARAVLAQARNERLRIEQTTEKVLASAPQNRYNQWANYVPADPAVEPEPRRSPWVTPSPALEPLRTDALVPVMMQWAGEVHRRCTEEGRIKTAVPWAERGPLSAADRRRAENWLSHAANAKGAGWAVQYRKDERAWYVNLRHFPDATALVNALAAVPPPRNEE